MAEPRQQQDPPPSARDLAERLRLLSDATHGSQVATAARLGIGMSDLQALERLLLNGPVGPAEISTSLGIRPASATALVDRLEGTGHVRREPHDSDRRRLVLVPTEKARRDGWAAVMPLVASLEAAAAELDDDQRRAVAGYLDRVIESLRAYAAQERPQ